MGVLKHKKAIKVFVDNLPKPPKYTKEQKVVKKALEHLVKARLRAGINNGDFDYAMGLLESLLIQDDELEGNNEK